VTSRHLTAVAVIGTIIAVGVARWLHIRREDRAWAATAASRVRDREYLAYLERELAGADLEVLTEMLRSNGRKP